MTRPKRPGVPRPTGPPSASASIRLVASERFVRLDNEPHRAFLALVREPGEAPYNVTFCVPLAGERKARRPPIQATA
jgi:hypothetical protein